MDKKVKLVTIAWMVLLLSLIFAFQPGSVNVNATCPPPSKNTVEFKYYVVAGCNTSSPALPTPDTVPAGFSFTFQNRNRATMNGVDFGSVMIYPDPIRYPASLNVKGVIWNITNNLGYNIIIQNITAEVTAGTRCTPYNFVYGQPPRMWGNISNVQVDILDRAWDEVDYNTGQITFCTEPPTYANLLKMTEEGMAQENKVYANGTIYGPETTVGMNGTGSLLEPDLGGDARSTGHVAPVLLPNGGRFTEYFGVWVGANSTTGTKIKGTITLRITYAPTSVTEKVCLLEVMNVVFKYRTVVITQAYQRWTVKVDVTVKNVGTVKLNCTAINLYYNQSAAVGWVQVPPSKTVTNLANWTQTTVTFDWNLATVPICNRRVKVNGTYECKPEGISCSFTSEGHLEQTVTDIIRPYSPPLVRWSLKVAKFGNCDAATPPACGISDVIAIFLNWGAIPPKNPKYDLDDTGVVGIGDNIVCFLNWGPETCTT